MLTYGVQTRVILGVPVRVTSPARTVVDCFRYRRKIGLDVAIEALQDCRRARRSSIDELWRYAAICRVTNVMRPYLEAVFAELQPESDPMLDFDERDLIRLAEATGFFPIDLEYHAEIKATDAKPWEAFIASSGNPKIPTIGEAMGRALSEDERTRFSEHLRPLVEHGRGVSRMGHAYLAAAKP